MKYKTRCLRRGCKKAGHFYPILMLVPMNDPNSTHYQESAITLPLCKEHKKEATVEMLITSDSWAEICKAFMSSGKPVPDRNRVGLRFIKIDDFMEANPELKTLGGN